MKPRKMKAGMMRGGMAKKKPTAMMRGGMASKDDKKGMGMMRGGMAKKPMNEGMKALKKEAPEVAKKMGYNKGGMASCGASNPAERPMKKGK